MTIQNGTLQHWGVRGMHWGIRKNHSSDHQAYTATKKKRLKDMTDEEVRLVAKRIGLVAQYKAAKLPRENRPKSISEMSNAELEAGIRRGKLLQEDWRVGVRKVKKITKMSDEEVSALLARHNLEKPIRDADRAKTLAAAKLVNEMVFGPTGQMLRAGVKTAIEIKKSSGGGS